MALTEQQELEIKAIEDATQAQKNQKAGFKYKIVASLATMAIGATAVIKAVSGENDTNLNTENVIEKTIEDNISPLHDKVGEYYSDKLNVEAGVVESYEPSFEANEKVVDESFVPRIEENENTKPVVEYDEESFVPRPGDDTNFISTSKQDLNDNRIETQQATPTPPSVDVYLYQMLKYNHQPNEEWITKSIVTVPQGNNQPETDKRDMRYVYVGSSIMSPNDIYVYKNNDGGYTIENEKVEGLELEGMYVRSKTKDEKSKRWNVFAQEYKDGNGNWVDQGIHGSLEGYERGETSIGGVESREKFVGTCENNFDDYYVWRIETRENENSEWKNTGEYTLTTVLPPVDSKNTKYVLVGFEREYEVSTRSKEMEITTDEQKEEYQRQFNEDVYALTNKGIKPHTSTIITKVMDENGVEREYVNYLVVPKNEFEQLAARTLEGVNNGLKDVYTSVDNAFYDKNALKYENLNVESFKNAKVGDYYLVAKDGHIDKIDDITAEGSIGNNKIIMSIENEGQTIGYTDVSHPNIEENREAERASIRGGM